MGAIPILSNVDALAETIAVPNPNRPIQNQVGQFGRLVCDRYSANPGAGELASFVQGAQPARAVLDVVCGPYWEAQGYSPPTEDVPFQGGQCATSYRVYLTRRNTVTGAAGTEFLRGTLTGPLVTTQTEPAPDCGEGAVGVPAVYIHTAGQSPQSGFAVNTSANGACVLFAPNTVIRLERVDGSPDSCGDPPGTPAPGPSPAPDPGPLPPDTGPKFDIRGNPILVLPPVITANGEVNIGFDIGEVNFGVGGSGVGPEPVPGDTVEPENSGEGGGEADFGEPPEGERWVGCCISLFNLPSGTPPIPRSTPQDIYAEVVGNARLKGGTGAAEFFDTPIQLRSKGVCLWEPVKGLRPTGIFVNLKLGIRYTVTPYSVPED